MRVKAHLLFGAFDVPKPITAAARNVVPLYTRRRQYDWTMTAVLASIPIAIAYDPSTIEASSFRHILDWGITPAGLGFAAGCVALIRGVSLAFNGYQMPWSAFGRIIGASGAGILWLEMGVALVELHLSTGRPPSIGILPWMIFAGSEVWSCYRAAIDAFDRTYR